MTRTAYIPRFNSTFDILLRDFFDTDGDFNSLTTMKVTHPIDIYEDGNGLHFEIACTGIDKKDVELTVEGDVLRVKYIRPSDSENVSDRRYISKTVARRSFNFGYRLSSRFNLQKIKATFENGLLRLDVPLADQAQPKKVNID
jgi:HSP20 family protein